jgi:Mrp family chromosome partitioning ATPase/capsular polysaccharide biosynthesis protein
MRQAWGSSSHGERPLSRDEAHNVSTLRDYAGVLWRRKWIVLIVVLLAVAAAFIVSERQKPVYEASAAVLLRHDDLAGVLTGVPDSGGTEDAVRVTQTQADLARVPPLAAQVVRVTRVPMTAAELLQSSRVTPKTNSDLLTFSVRHGQPAVATQLATAYAREYTVYRRQLDTAAIVRARREAENRIAELAAAGNTQLRLYSTLVENVQLLNTMVALQTSNAYLVVPADSADKVLPQPARNMALALALAVILGGGLAFLREILDTRVRSAEEISSRLGLPLLARLRVPPKKLRSIDHLVMLDEPNSPDAEAFRVLRTNLDFVNLDRQARTIMLTSAVEGEGKSTTAANLAVTLARSGRRVLLVDLDTRRPFIHRFFDLPQEVGLTRVALGHVPLDSALTRVPLAQSSENDPFRSSGNGAGGAEGVLEVLTSGPMPPNPGEFATSKALADILHMLRERADIVLVDAPPLLHLGDALALSSQVDALVLITRLHTLRKSMLAELRRVLDASPAAKVGFVLAGAELEEGSGYAAYGAYYTPKEQKEPEDRNALQRVS